MLIFMLSLAGIPPLAGFWGKYFIFLSLIATGHYALAALGVLYSVFGLYYYLKIANAMFMGKVEKGEEKLPVSFTMRAALGLARWPRSTSESCPTASSRWSTGRWASRRIRPSRGSRTRADCKDDVRGHNRPAGALG